MSQFEHEMHWESRMRLFPFASANGRSFSQFPAERLSIGLDAGRGSQGAGQLGKYKIEDTRFMTTKLFTKPLDDSNGSIKVNHNNAMQLASQTKKTPWHLRFAPGAILRQIGLAVLALTMLVGVQTPPVNSEITSVIDRWHWGGSTGHHYRLVDVVVFGIGDPYSGVYGSNNPKWKITRIRPVTIQFINARIKSINETLGDDLGRGLKKYMGDIDYMTASAARAAASCMIRNSSAKFPGCVASWLNSWEVHLLFAIEELEGSVNSAVSRANSSASSLVSSYSN